MLIDRQFIAPDSPHVKAIADGFNLMPVVASAWVEMMLQRPGGAEKIHDRLQVCIDVADERGDLRACETLRGATGVFDRLCETGLESDAAEYVQGKVSEPVAEVPPAADMEPRPLVGSETAGQPIMVTSPAPETMSRDIGPTREAPEAGGPALPAGGPNVVEDSGLAPDIIQATAKAKEALRRARM